MARVYHRARGEGSRIRFIGRAKAYHGMGWGGLSISGLGRHRRDFGPLLPEVDHLPHTHNLEHAAFSRGQPQWGAHLADELMALLQIHDPSTAAAVIVEPVTGSGGVLPPPVGYLERLRAIDWRQSGSRRSTRSQMLAMSSISATSVYWRRSTSNLATARQERAARNPPTAASTKEF